MNSTLWILQVLLAIHTAIGAVWKFSNPESAVPSLRIPHAIWLGLGVIELACSLLLVLPIVYKPVAHLAPVAALFVALEMLAFCVLHLSSGDQNYGPMMYWLVVALLAGFIAYGRFAIAPH